MKMYDNGNHSIFRVVCRNYLPTGMVQLDTWNVKASTLADAKEWVISHRSWGLTSMVTTGYKLRRQPVWLKKTGQLDARFDLRDRETFRPTPL